MDDKEKYLHAMKINKGNLDEITPRETIGFGEETTIKIISRLLSEFKIDYEEDGQCSYRVRDRNINILNEVKISAS